jgi:hypothetical protein
MPSLPLRCACWMLRMSARKLSEIARPAASSEARVMRRPEDRRERLRCRPFVELVRLRCALI